MKEKQMIFNKWDYVRHLLIFQMHMHSLICKHINLLQIERGECIAENRMNSRNIHSLLTHLEKFNKTI